MQTRKATQVPKFFWTLVDDWMKTGFDEVLLKAPTARFWGFVRRTLRVYVGGGGGGAKVLSSKPAKTPAVIPKTWVNSM